MAEIAVSLVTNQLIPWLLQEVKLLKGVKGEVVEIKNELESIQSFLKDADSRDADQAGRGDNSMNEGLKTWVKQVRETAYDIEDVVDEYMLSAAQYHHQRGFIGFLSKPARKLKLRDEIAEKIQSIKQAIDKVKERRSRYRLNLNSFDQGSRSSSHNIVPWHDPRVASLFVDDAEIVGIESARSELIHLLIHGEVAKRMVISVVGMGGLGKTTLVKKVYDHQIVPGSFDCHAWISVSQSYKMGELLKNLIRQFCQEREETVPEGIDVMTEEVLFKKLSQILQQKKYVVVFDDVWRVDFWGTIKFALPDNNKGSRIIITTRSEDVGSSCKESSFHHVYKLQHLPEKRAWELFCKKAFQSDSGGRCPPELEDLSLKIVRRCEGLPIAIATIGSLLSTKGKDVSQWQKMHDSLGLELESNPRLVSITRILFLSYHELPYYLKCCFLYFGMFPEDYSISCTRLIRLWIAEGFIEKKREKPLEEVAKDYLTELIHRSLVQVSHIGFDGKARRCRVHDLMREMIISKVEELNFCKVVAEEGPSFDGRTRRISIQRSKYNVVESINNSPLRSISLFEANRLPESLMATFFTNFKFLKVLDFQDAPLDYVPEELGSLFHLRYLSVRCTRVKTLPKSIGQLHSLQTLDLKHSLVNKLPIEIKELYNLRHLLAKSLNYGGVDFEFLQGVKIQEGVIGCLEALQKLYLVEAPNHGVGLFTELKKLTHMRKLGIRKIKWEQGRPLCASIEKMKTLESLTLHSESADEVLDIQHISIPPPNLRQLYLQGRLTMLPNWIGKLQHLVRIHVNWAGLTPDPLKVLQALPNLLELGLYHAFDGHQLHFKDIGFQKLKVLRLSFLNRLNRVIIDSGALPLLGQLTIRSCQQLETLPIGIRYLRKATVNFFDMPQDLESQMYQFVQYVQAVVFNYRREGGGYDSYTLG